jgi:hypothetical protein
MSTQIRRRIRVAIFHTILLSSLGAGVAANSAQAVDCLTAPNSPASRNSHWYYLTDRAQRRKCWHLGAANPLFQQGQLFQQGSVQVEPGSAAAKPLHSSSAEGSYSLAIFKDFIKHRKGTDWSNEDVEGLYAGFLEWNRQTKN